MNILIVGPAWVGDTVISQVMLRLLLERHPGAAIDYLAPPWTLPLIERMPEVRRGLLNPFGHGTLRLGDRRRLGQSLRAARYGQAIVLPNSWKSALPPWFASIPCRTGYRGEARWGLLNDLRQLDRAGLPQMAQRFAALALPAGEPLPARLPPPKLATAPSQQLQLLERLGLQTRRPAVAFCPGAEYGPAKRWPETHFAALAREFASRGWTVWLLGSRKDHGIAATIAELSPGACVNLCGHTNIAEAADLLAAARLTVSNDSGLMHVAAAVGRPVIAIYGSSSPGFTPPLSPDARIMSLELGCSPCFQRHCPLGHLDCLNRLLPQQIISAIDFATLSDD